MPFKYFLKPSHEDSHQTSTHWIALILPFKNRDSFDRQRFVATNISPGGSVSLEDIDPVETGEPLVLDNEVISWAVNHSKRSPTGTCSLTLAPTKNFKKLVTGGDWVLFWAFDNREDYERIRSNLQARPMLKSNGFMDGLKFVGRIAGVKSSKRRSGTGPVLTSYNISATSFRELETTIFYDPALQAKYGNNSLGKMIDFGGDINSFILGSLTDRGSVNGGRALQRLLNVCVGLGPSDSWKRGVNPKIKNEEGKPYSELTASPNGRMLIPRGVADVLLSKYHNDKSSYADLLSSLVGIQYYSVGGKASRLVPLDPGEGFVPRFKSDIRETLSGEFHPQPPDFNQKTVWQLLEIYLNSPINEMYTTLRVGAGNDILPTFVARQVPFSSMLFSKRDQSRHTTAFVDLPRWVLPPSLVDSDELGTSDSLRFNYFFLPSYDKVGQQSQSQSYNRTINPPYVDTVDIERSGLRMYGREVMGHFSDMHHTFEDSPGRYWSRMMSDIISGQHLRESGTISAVFLQEPIPVGDNLEYDGGIFHIEGITHQGAISGDGKRSAETSFSVSSGISTASDDADDNVYLISRGVAGELHVEEQQDRADPKAEDWRFFETSIHDRR